MPLELLRVDRAARVGEVGQRELRGGLAEQRRDDDALVGGVLDADRQHEQPGARTPRAESGSDSSPRAPRARARLASARWRRGSGGRSPPAPPPMAMMNAASHTRFTSGRTWMRTLQRPAPRSSPSATQDVAAVMHLDGGLGGHLTLYPVLTLLRGEHRNRGAVARDDDRAPDAVVVRSLDGTARRRSGTRSRRPCVLCPGASATSRSRVKDSTVVRAITNRPRPMCATVMPSTARGSDSSRRSRSIGSTSEERMIQIPSVAPTGVSTRRHGIDAETIRPTASTTAASRRQEQHALAVPEAPALPVGSGCRATAAPAAAASTAGRSD